MLHFCAKFNIGKSAMQTRSNEFWGVTLESFEHFWCRALNYGLTSNDPDLFRIDCLFSSHSGVFTCKCNIGVPLSIISIPFMCDISQHAFYDLWAAVDSTCMFLCHCLTLRGQSGCRPPNSPAQLP